MISFSVSAPGKVILFGEHSVVYGKTAVAASLNRRTILEFNELASDESRVYLELPKVELALEIPVEQIRAELFAADLPKLADATGHESLLQCVRGFVARIQPEPTSRQKASLECLFFALLQVAQSDGLQLGAFRLKLDSELAVGAGLGSSASFAVCLVAGFLRLAQLQKDPRAPEFGADDLDKISRYALNCEKIMHGAPSGIDNSICTYGSIIEFRKGESIKFIPTTNSRSMRILLVDTKVPRSTKALVAKVAGLKAKYPQIFDRVLESMDELARQVVDLVKNMQALPDDDKNQLLDIYQEISDLVDINQGLLSTCMVSHPSLDLICLTAKKHGFSAKLTGAGGGGFAYVIISPNASSEQIEQLSSELTANNFLVSETSLGSFGIKVDNEKYC